MKNNKKSKLHEKQPSVHTIPSKDVGWDTMQDGEILNHYETKADAIAESELRQLKTGQNTKFINFKV